MVGEQYRQLVALCDVGEQLGIFYIAAWGDECAGEVDVRLLVSGGSGMAWVGKIGAHGQSDAGTVDVNHAAITAGGAVHILAFVKVLF